MASADAMLLTGSSARAVYSIEIDGHHHAGLKTRQQLGLRPPTSVARDAQLDSGDAVVVPGGRRSHGDPTKSATPDARRARRPHLRAPSPRRGRLGRTARTRGLVVRTTYRLGRRAVVSSVAIAVALFALRSLSAEAVRPPLDEVRAVWVTRTTLASPAGIAQMVRSAKDAGFNTLIVQVRGRGDAFYHSTLEPRAGELTALSDFDPLAVVLAHARPAGLRVHAWVNANLVSSAVTLPASRQHVIYRHPEWLMVPKELAAEMQTIDPRSPQYLGRLARWTRTRAADVEGLYTSPLHPDAAAHVARVAGDIVSRYDVNGVHLDYVRFPSPDFDYSRAALQEFKRSLLPDLSADERRRADAREADDPTFYTNMFPERWRSYRQARLTAMVSQVRKAITAANPDVVLSAAVVPDLAAARALKMQDWRSWLDQSLLDVLCPMAYTQDRDLFGRQVRDARDLAGARPVWAGIGAYRLSRAATLEHIATARYAGADGVVLFSYDALVSAPNSQASFAALGRAAFAPTQ